MFLLGAVAAAGHVLYPMFLAIRTRHLTDEHPPPLDTWPPLTVVVPAYREESVITAKVADVMANGYCGPLRMIVVADDPKTAAAARHTQASVLAGTERMGKARAVNVGMAEAQTEVVVLTDANTLLRPGSLAAMVRWFADPTVGAVAGEKTLVGGSGESAYWRFESWLKQREARTGFTVGLVGELVAVRRDTFRPLPTDLTVEDLWMAIDVLEAGRRVVYERTACAAEEPAEGWRDDWERRTRVGSGILDVLWRRRERLAPNQGMVAAQLWGHRAIRSSFGPLAHLVLLVLAASRCRRSVLAAMTVAGHLAAGAAMVRTQRRTAGSGVERLLGQAMFLQAVGVGGLFRYLRRDLNALWPKPERSTSALPQSGSQRGPA